MALKTLSCKHSMRQAIEGEGVDRSTEVVADAVDPYSESLSRLGNPGVVAMGGGLAVVYVPTEQIIESLPSGCVARTSCLSECRIEPL